MIRDISVIIPVYNEETCIGQVVDQVEAVLEKLDLGGYEIIAVNDGSTDRTGEILKQKPVMLLEHMSNQGYGASIKHGVSRARHEHIIRQLKQVNSFREFKTKLRAGLKIFRMKSNRNVES